jgi:hypothetical protein
VNRVLDYAQHGTARVINTIVPEVNADMVTYSFYDSTNTGQDAASMQSALNLALHTIEKLAPDPLGMGNRRIVLSEYGLFETLLLAGPLGEPRPFWRPQAVQGSTAHSCGICTTMNVSNLTGNPLRWIRLCEVRYAPPTQIARGCG